VQQFGLHDFDVERDGFEMEVLSYADQHELSILGICRGLQVVNVFFGGTLVPDIPSFGNPDHMRFADEVDRRHTVAVREKSFLRSITAAKGEVNSAHHQSADLLGEGLVANAYCDKVVEGLERSSLDNPFLLLVQWHPERMIDQQSVFSKNIRESFIESCQ
jgi:putative glutamine amidotransferase